jgi:hypothetical protein
MWKSLQASGSDGDAEDQQNFYSLLAEEMIDNNINSRARRARLAREEGPCLTFSSPNLIKCTRVKTNMLQMEASQEVFQQHIHNKINARFALEK